MFPFSATSVHTPPATLTTIFPSASGVTTNVYVSPSTGTNAPLVPFTTVISPTTNPVTFSSNSNVYVIGLSFVGLVLSGVIVNDGCPSSSDESIIVTSALVFPYASASVTTTSAANVTSPPLAAIVSVSFCASQP